MNGGDAKDTGQDLVDTKTQILDLFAGLISLCAYSAQGRCGSRLQETLKYFVHATEAAKLDVGLLDLSKLSLSDERSKRHFQDIPEQASISALLGGEYKMMNPFCTASYTGGLYAHKFSVQEAQKEHAAFFLIMTPSDPSQIAVIPKWYLQNRPNSRIEKASLYSGSEVALTMGACEPFPPEYSPFILPFLPEHGAEHDDTYLETFIQGMLDAFWDPAKSWYVYVNKMVFWWS